MTPKYPPLNELIRTYIKQRYGVDPYKHKGDSVNHELRNALQIACYILKQHRQTNAEIGEILGIGGSTVLNYVLTITERMEDSKAWSEELGKASAEFMIIWHNSRNVPRETGLL